RTRDVATGGTSRVTTLPLVGVAARAVRPRARAGREHARHAGAPRDHRQSGVHRRGCDRAGAGGGRQRRPGRDVAGGVAGLDAEGVARPTGQRPDRVARRARAPDERAALVDVVAGDADVVARAGPGERDAARARGALGESARRAWSTRIDAAAAGVEALDHGLEPGVGIQCPVPRRPGPGEVARTKLVRGRPEIDHRLELAHGRQPELLTRAGP